MTLRIYFTIYEMCLWVNSPTTRFRASPLSLALICCYLIYLLLHHLLINQRPLLFFSSATGNAISKENSLSPMKELAKAPDGEGCPRCGVFVYAAEQMLGREKVTTERVILFTFY